LLVSNNYVPVILDIDSTLVPYRLSCLKKRKNKEILRHKKLIFFSVKIDRYKIDSLFLNLDYAEENE